MASFPLMSNTAHSRHHRKVVASETPRKRSFIGQMFLSRDKDLEVAPNVNEKNGIMNDEQNRLKFEKKFATASSEPATPTSTHRPNSKLEWSKPNLDIYGPASNRVRSSSLPTVIQGLSGFDHHHVHLERHPHTPQFHATRNFLREFY